MKQHKDILVKNSINKASEALSDAEYSLEGNRLSTLITGFTMLYFMR